MYATYVFYFWFYYSFVIVPIYYSLFFFFGVLYPFFGTLQCHCTVHPQARRDVYDIHRQYDYELTMNRAFL